MNFFVQPLVLMTFFPLVGVLALLFINSEAKNALRWTALITSLITFLLSLWVLAMFNSSNPDLQLVARYPWITVAGFNIQFFLGVDGLSILLVLLTTLLMLPMMMCMAVVGLFVIPYKRKQAKERFREKTEDLRKRLLGARRRAPEQHGDRRAQGMADQCRFSNTEFFHEIIEKPNLILEPVPVDLLTRIAKPPQVKGIGAVFHAELLHCWHPVAP